MKTMKVTGAALLATVVALWLGSLLLPRSYNVERKVGVQAPVTVVHGLVGDLKQWSVWAPWHDQDPTLKTTLGPVTQGVGAHQEWEGESGQGELTLTASDPQKGVEFNLLFDDGRFTSTGAIAYVPEGDTTEVTWSLSGYHHGPIARYFGLIMDRYVGHSFEHGLGKLKAEAERRVAEGEPSAPQGEPEQETESEEGEYDADQDPTELAP